MIIRYRQRPRLCAPNQLLMRCRLGLGAVLVVQELSSILIGGAAMPRDPCRQSTCRAAARQHDVSWPRLHRGALASAGGRPRKIPAPRAADWAPLTVMREAAPSGELLERANDVAERISALRGVERQWCRVSFARAAPRSRRYRFSARAGFVVMLCRSLSNRQDAMVARRATARNVQVLQMPN